MGNQANRDAIRAYMREHDVNYTTARRATAATTVSDPLGDYVRAVLMEWRECRLRLEAHRRRLEGEGYRIVYWGQATRPNWWEVIDFRTDDVLACLPEDDIGKMDEILARLDPGDTWFHEDHIFPLVGDELKQADLGDLPPGLAASLRAWTTDARPEDVALLVGWTTEKVEACLAG